MSTSVIGDDHVSFSSLIPRSRPILQPIVSTQPTEPLNSNKDTKLAGLSSRIKTIMANINHQLSSPPDSLSPRLRFEPVTLEDFAALIDTSFYKNLSKSHVRLGYNSASKVLIVQCMTTPVHDSAQPFINYALFANPIIQPLGGLVDILSGTDFVGFTGLYKMSQKQPDVLVKVGDSYWPSLVVETGWSEDYHDLVESAKLWLIGSQGGSSVAANRRQPVTAVILISYDHKEFDADQSKSIIGTFEVWRRSPTETGKIKKSLSTQFFPNVPANAPLVKFTLAEILRAKNVPLGQSGEAIIVFDLQDLANRVRRGIKHLIQNLDGKRTLGIFEVKTGRGGRE